jgi:hypothetical protein
MRTGWRSGTAGALLAVLLAAACDDATAAQGCGRGGRESGGRRILFIGNSLTYYNAFPAMFAALADSAGMEAPRVEQVALPDYGLKEHWEDGRAAEAIRGGCWDVVVLQQGPSAQAESRALLLDYAGRFDALVRSRGGRPALFAVWPSQSRAGDFERAIESYVLAAESVDGILLPAATAWLEAWARDPGLDLYADALHPSAEGSYLAALVMVGRLYGLSPVGLSAGLDYRPRGAPPLELRLDPAVALALQQAAQAALDRHSCSLRMDL